MTKTNTIENVLIDDLAALVAALVKQGLTFNVTSGTKVACWDIKLLGGY